MAHYTTLVTSALFSFHGQQYRPAIYYRELPHPMPPPPTTGGGGTAGGGIVITAPADA